MLQHRMKKYADQGQRNLEFQKGDMVYLKLWPYCQRSLARHINEKLSPIYFRPYELVQKIGQVAYKLDLPKTAAIHPVFNVSLLKKAIGDTIKSHHCLR